MEKQDVRILRSKEMLVGALIKLMETIDAENITIRQLTQTAQLSRTTFYLHYEDMPCFLRRLTEETFADLIKQVGQGRADLSDQQEGREYYLAYFQFIQERKAFFRAMLGPHGYFGFRQKFMEIGRERYFALLQPFQRKIEEKVAVDILVYYIISAHVGLVEYWLQNDCKYSADYMAKQVQYLTVECLKPVTALKTKINLPH